MILNIVLITAYFEMIYTIDPFNTHCKVQYFQRLSIYNICLYIICLINEKM